jgi:hypothetical protein
VLKVAWFEIVSSRAPAAPRRRTRARAPAHRARALVASASAPVRRLSRAPSLGVRAPRCLVFIPRRVTPCRSHRTRARRAQGGPPVRPAPRRTTAESTPSPRRHRRPSALFKGRAPSRARRAEPPTISVSPSMDAATTEL